jgi:hypothetical protein
MLHRTEPSTVVILLASVISPLSPFATTRRQSRRTCQDISFHVLLCSCLCCFYFSSSRAESNPIQASTTVFRKLSL